MNKIVTFILLFVAAIFFGYYVMPYIIGAIAGDYGNSGIIFGSIFLLIILAAMMRSRGKFNLKLWKKLGLISSN